MAASSAKFLSKSATLLCLASLASPAMAADINITSGTDFGTQTATAPGDDINVTGSGAVEVTNGEAITSANIPNVRVLVDTTGAGVSNTGQFNTIDFTDPLTSIDEIRITRGLVTGNNSNAGLGTISAATLGGSFTITVGTNGSVTNTGTGGDAIIIQGDNGDQAATVDNSGTISTTDDAGSVALNLADADGGSSLNVINSGTINAGTLGSAVSALAGNAVDIANTGTITGNINIAGTSTLTLTNSGNGTTTGLITGDITAGSGVATITNNSASRIVGDIDLGTAATSELILNGTSSVTGNVTIANGNDIRINGTGNTITGTIDGAGDLDLNSSFATGGIIGGGVGLATIDVATGTTFTVNHNVTATTTTVNGTGTIDLGDTSHVYTGAIDLSGAGAGTLDFGRGAHTGVTTLTTGTGDSLALDFFNSASNTQSAGSLAVTTSDIGAGTAVSLNSNITSLGYVNQNLTGYTILTGTTAGSDISNITNADLAAYDTAVLNFGLVQINANTLGLSVARTSYADVATNANNRAVGNLLEQFGSATTDSGTMTQLLGALDAAPTVAQANLLLESATPQADNSATQGLFNVASQSFDVVQDRLGSARSSTRLANKVVEERGIFAQVFGSAASQGARNSVTGYDANTYGVIFGGDKKIDDKTRLGVSFNYANTGISSENKLKTTDVDTYQANVYGTREFGAYYAEGALGFAWNELETDRTVPGITRANGDFSGQTYMARIGAGYNKKLKSGVEINPHLGLTYAHSELEDYTETGAGALNLHVDNRSADILEPRAGIKANYTFSDDGVKIRPELRASVGYDVIGQNQSTTSRFVNTTPAFNTNASNIARTSLALGTGIDIVSLDNYTLTADYDFELRSDYTAHSGLVRLRYDF